MINPWTYVKQYVMLYICTKFDICTLIEKNLAQDHWHLLA